MASRAAGGRRNRADRCLRRARRRRAGVPWSGLGPRSRALAVAAERGAVEPPGARRGRRRRRARPRRGARSASFPHVVRESLDRAPEGGTVTDVGSTKRPVSRRRGRRPAVRRRAPDLRRRDARAGARDGRALRRRDVVPHADRRDGAGAAAARARVRLVARRATRRDRPGRPRPARRGHEPSPARARERPAEPGRSARVDGHDPLQAAGGSLRDMTRIGGANPRIWVDIFLDNREALAAALAEQRRLLEQVEAALAAGDAGFLARWIGEASGHRRRMLETAFVDPGTLHRRPDAHPGPAGSARGDLPGARRRADQRRGLRARPRLGRPRRDADDARLRRERGRSRPRSCSRRRATASSSRR